MNHGSHISGSQGSQGKKSWAGSQGKKKLGWKSGGKRQLKNLFISLHWSTACAPVNFVILWFHLVHNKGKWPLKRPRFTILDGTADFRIFILF